MSLRDDLREKRLVVLMGTGGVGKTTIAAAAALEGARSRRTLVLTIDPARRLADSLGVRLGSEVANVRPNLDALMLDTKAALDALVRRYATSPETLRRIARSRFYEQLSDAFAGSEEFVAMGTLHDLLEDGGYDLVVVDTPPSAHAVEFLDVNRKLLRVFESGVVRYLFRPTRFLRLSGGYMAHALSRWTSSEYVEEFAEFVTTFDQMFNDMEARVRSIHAVLADPARTALHVVTTLDEEGVARTARLHDDVARLGLRVSGCVANRVFRRLPGAEAARRPDAEAARRLAEAARVDEAAARAFLADAARAGRFHDAIAEDHARYRDRLASLLPVPIADVPALAGSVHDLDGLERVRAALFG